MSTITVLSTRPGRNAGRPSPTSPGPAGLHHLPDLPAGLIIDAQHAIAAWLSSGFPDPELDHLTHAERMRRYTYNSYGDHALRDSAPLHRLFAHYNPIVRKVIGTDAWRASDVQIALRMPGEVGAPHIDGTATGNPADPRIPNAVLGVYLSDVGMHDGAFAVWPQLWDDVRRYGMVLADNAHADDGRILYGKIIGQCQENPPHAVTGGAGTAFLVHGGLAHGNLPNLGTGIRYAIFARYYRDGTYPYGFDADNVGRAWSILASPEQAWAATSGGRTFNSAEIPGSRDLATGPALVSTRRTVRSWEEFAETVTTGWAVAFHCGRPECQDDIKAQTSAGPRCIPTEEPPEERLCIGCNQASASGKWLVFGREY